MVKIIRWCFNILTVFLLLVVFKLNAFASTTDYIISTVQDFLAMNDPTGNYSLANDLDFSQTPYVPLFTDSVHPFSGTFDGNNHQLIGIDFEVDTSADIDTGLFAYVDHATIKNIRINDVDFSITGNPLDQDSVGILAGTAISSHFTNIKIIRASITTQANVPFIVGGIVGSAMTSDFDHIQADIRYQGDAQYLGGLVGIYMDASSNPIQDIALKVNFDGADIMGGLFGGYYESDVSHLSINRISVRGVMRSDNAASALFGAAYLLELQASDVTTAVSLQANNALASSVYSTVTSDNFITSSTLTRFFSQNSVSLSNSVALLTPPNAFLDTAGCEDCIYLSNQGLIHSSAPALTSTQAQDSSNFPHYDFSTLWVIHPKLNEGRPYLRYGLETLDFEENGGSVLDPQPFFPYEAIPTPLSSTRTGYTFDGWYSDSALTQAFDFSATTHSSSQTLYAKWSLNAYTLRFEENGGSTVSDITQNYASTVNEPTNPTKMGYSFGGWYSDSGFSNVYTFSTMPASNTTLYAKWTSITTPTNPTPEPTVQTAERLPNTGLGLNLNFIVVGLGLVILKTSRKSLH